MLFWTVLLTKLLWFLTSPFGIPRWFPWIVLVALIILIWWTVRRRREEEAQGWARSRAAAEARPIDAARRTDAGRAPRTPMPPAPPPRATAQRPEVTRPTPASGPRAEGLKPRPAPSSPDDLRRIEGIGPRISGILREAGITTFAQLAHTDVSRLRTILSESGLRAPADPTTWPEQAKLAAAGDWDGLAALQAELERGRRV